jgi:toxin ParE1/3/4
MSSHKLRLSRRAQGDLRSILQFSYDTWGESKQVAYAESFERAFSHLLTFPEVGRIWSEIRENVRVFPVERHLILYRVTSTESIIERIVHTHQDIEGIELD